MLFPRWIWKVRNAPPNEVYITFDDGPHPEITPWVIDQLLERNMRATFFCIGDNARKYPAVMNQLRAAGMGIGNHSMHHLNGWKNNTHEYIENVLLAREYIGESRLFRPPYGRIKGSQAQLLKEDFKIVMWSYVTGDWKSTLNRQVVLSDLKRFTESGFIPVFHDSEKAWHNVREILPAYLDFLHESNLTSAKLPND